MFPNLTCGALQRSHQDRRASFSSCVLQMPLRVHLRMSFALSCSTDDICASCFSLQSAAVVTLCPSNCFLPLWAWDHLRIGCVCFIPSARPLIQIVIRIKPRTEREDNLAALICRTLEKSSSPAVTLVSEGRLQSSASMCVLVSRFHPIFPM